MGNFDRVEELMQNVEERDAFMAFQSPIKGVEIMKELELSPGKLVGDIKSRIEDAILDGEIKNSYEAAYDFFQKIKQEYSKKGEMIPLQYLTNETHRPSIHSSPVTTHRLPLTTHQLPLTLFLELRI